MKHILIMLFLILYILVKAQSFVENSIGVVHVVSESDTEYELIIIFPFKCFMDYEVEKPITEIKYIIAEFELDYSIVLFNEKGRITEINEIPKIDFKFWCENDGNIQYRPEVKLKINKNIINRRLTKKFKINEISCFALINENKDIPISPILSENLIGDVKLKGDLNNDGEFESAILLYPDETGICSKTMKLLIKERSDYLNCCGP